MRIRTTNETVRDTDALSGSDQPLVTSDNNESSDLSLVPQESSPGTSVSKETLCSQCQNVEIETFFDEPDGNEHPHAVVLGPLHEMAERVDNCALCRLIIKALEMSWTGLPLRPPVRNIFQSVRLNMSCQLKSTAATTTEGPVRSIEIDVFEGKHYTERALDARRLFQTELRLLVDDAPKLGLEELGHGRLIGDVCESSLLKSWYRKCVDCHKQSCSDTKQNTQFAPASRAKIVLPKTMRVIDVNDMNVIPAPKDCTYVALSYVWGDATKVTAKKNTIERWRRKGSLTKLQLPKTFTDAIDLTRDLGEKYLWIDALCIAQDSNQLAEQLDQMDIVYGQASLVISAAAGKDANEGLPGYAKRPRPSSNQYVETIQGLRLLASSAPLEYVLKNSKWDTRGWTFQEWSLARRALVFTSSQVYFICNGVSYCEDIALETAPAHKPVWLIMEQCTASTHRHYLEFRYMALSINSGFRDYRQVVREYSPRELTHESDVLVAISGVLNNLHRASRNRFICGMSVGLLHDALFWVPAGPEPLQRRGASPAHKGVAFPSWSWAGWKGGVKYDNWPGALRANIEEWFVLSADGKDTLLGILGTPLTEPQDDHLVTNTGTVFFTGRDDIMAPDKERARQGEGGLPHNIVTPCRLAFVAHTAMFRVVCGLDGIDMNGPAEGIVSAEGAWIGTVWFDTRRPPMERVIHNFQSYFFVAIATVNEPVGREPVDGFRSYDEEYCEWLNVLVVKPGDGGVCERLGVGQIRKWSWDHENEQHKLKALVILA